MIRVMNDELVRLGMIKNVITASHKEVLNGELTLDFEAILDSKLNSFIDDNSIFELENNYFDIAAYTKTSNEDGTFTIEVEAEHVSYRLNNPQYDREFFTEYGSPSYILSKILEGTGFSIGILDFPTDVITYSAQEAKSGRQLLMEFVAYLTGEVIFDKFTISIVQHRGSTEVKRVMNDKNVKVISKKVDKRLLDEEGKPTISYACQPLYLPNDNYEIGDEVRLLQNDIGIAESFRIVSMDTNPYDISENSFEFANYINGLESNIYRIETQSVVKDALMNGIRIGPEFGFEAVRNDKRARAYFRSDGLAMQSGDGSGDNWRDRLYYAYNSLTDETELIYDGRLSVDLLELISGLVTPFLYAENGVIANAVVRRLRTDLSKPWRYLQGDTTDVHYQDIGDTEEASGRYFRLDKVKGDAPDVQFSISAMDGSSGEVLLWWYNGKEGGSMTTNPEYAKAEDSNTPVPVMVFQYETKTLHSSLLVKSKKTDEWGVHDQWGAGKDEYGRGAGIIEKTDEYMTMILEPGQGEDIGGIRISIDKGVELYSLKSKTWGIPVIDGTNATLSNLSVVNSVIETNIGTRQRNDLIKVLNYLKGDTSDVYYSDVNQENVRLRRSVTDGSETEQFQSVNETPYWWFKNIEGGKITTVKNSETDLPVMIYKYTTQTLSNMGITTFNYSTSEGDYTLKQPSIHLFRQDQIEEEYGYIYLHDTGGLRMAYKTIDGSQNYIDIGEEGIKTSPNIGGGLPAISEITINSNSQWTILNADGEVEIFTATFE